jgi:hypothetical protein
MPREVSAEFRAAAEASSTGEVFLTFATITHPALSRAIRVVCDVVDYIYGGERFIGCPFDITILTDGEDKPTAKIAIQNVDREIGETIQSLVEGPRLKLEVLLLSQFSADTDQFLGARTEVDTAVPDYVADQLRLAKVSLDAMTVTGDVISWDYSSEPWPFYRATKNRLPGLFR